MALNAFSTRGLSMHASNFSSSKSSTLSEGLNDAATGVCSPDFEADSDVFGSVIGIDSVGGAPVASTCAEFSFRAIVGVLSRVLLGVLKAASEWESTSNSECVSAESSRSMLYAG